METETHIHLQKGKVEAFVWKVRHKQAKVRTDSSEVFGIFYGKVYRLEQFVHLKNFNNFIHHYFSLFIIQHIKLLFFYS